MPERARCTAVPDNFSFVHYQRDDNFLNIEQIIPIKDTQEFTIGLANKAQDEAQISSEEADRHKRRRDFWNELLPVMRAKSDLFANVSAGNRSGISAGSGTRGVYFDLVITNKQVWVCCNLY